MTRKDAREFAMQTIFQMDAQKDLNSLSVEKYIEEKDLADQKEYVKELLSSICDNQETVDGTIDQCSDGWPACRLAKADLAIMRIALGEIFYMQNVPNSVAINEAVNMAKIYGTDRSARFINAVLGKVEI